MAERITAPDPQTVVIKIAEPQSPTFLLYCLSANVGGVVDKKTVMQHAQGDDLGNGWLKQNSAGSGPWALRSWRANEFVALDANPNHPAPPKLKRLLILHRPDPSAQLLALQKGDIDIARTLSPEQLKTLQEDPDYTMVSATKANLVYLAMNQKNANLAKPQVRQAIKWAIDYQAIAKNITPNLYVAAPGVPAEGPARRADRPAVPEGRRQGEGADEGGRAANGFEITLDHQSTRRFADIAQAMQADLGAIGIKVRLLRGGLPAGHHQDPRAPARAGHAALGLRLHGPAQQRRRPSA